MVRTSRARRTTSRTSSSWRILAGRGHMHHVPAVRTSRHLPDLSGSGVDRGMLDDRGRGLGATPVAGPLRSLTMPPAWPSSRALEVIGLTSARDRWHVRWRNAVRIFPDQRIASRSGGGGQLPQLGHGSQFPYPGFPIDDPHVSLHRPLPLPSRSAPEPEPSSGVVDRGSRARWGVGRLISPSSYYRVLRRRETTSCSPSLAPFIERVSRPAPADSPDSAGAGSRRYATAESTVEHAPIRA